MLSAFVTSWDVLGGIMQDTNIRFTFTYKSCKLDRIMCYLPETEIKSLKIKFVNTFIFITTVHNIRHVRI